jgi:hypothetical protein
MGAAGLAIIYRDWSTMPYDVVDIASGLTILPLHSTYAEAARHAGDIVDAEPAREVDPRLTADEAPW